MFTKNVVMRLVVVSAVLAQHPAIAQELSVVDQGAYDPAPTVPLVTIGFGPSDLGWTGYLTTPINVSGAPNYTPPVLSNFMNPAATRSDTRFATQHGYVPSSYAPIFPRTLPLLPPPNKAVNELVEREMRPRWEAMHRRNLMTTTELSQIVFAARTSPIHLVDPADIPSNYAFYSSGRSPGDAPRGVHVAAKVLESDIKNDQQLGYLLDHELTHSFEDLVLPMIEVDSGADRTDYMASYLASEAKAFGGHLRYVVSEQLRAMDVGDYRTLHTMMSDAARNLLPNGQTPMEFYQSTIRPEMTADEVAAHFEAAVWPALYFQPLPYLDGKTYFQMYGDGYDEYHKDVYEAYE